MPSLSNPYSPQMHVLYCEKITVAEYRLAIWSNKDTLYYNDLPEKEVERFVSLIEYRVTCPVGIGRTYGAFLFLHYIFYKLPCMPVLYL